jgi:hypothetical protein
VYIIDEYLSDVIVGFIKGKWTPPPHYKVEK